MIPAKKMESNRDTHTSSDEQYRCEQKQSHSEKVDEPVIDCVIDLPLSLLAPTSVRDAKETPSPEPILVYFAIEGKWKKVDPDFVK